MKLLRVDVEHFACIHQASVDLGPGLNVLFGPNDLGKSTLARAIRAALLIQHTSSAANDFVEWNSGEDPSVKLTLEIPDRQIWRVEKRFASSGGSSILRTSTDGKTFSPYKKAREVDDELRTMLGWGIASPATKGAPRGLPTSFLATVLLGEQTDVAGVLQQTIEVDSDESGRARLTSALAAFAQDPLFKSILEEAQAKVDMAFTPKGSKKSGKTSPFREVTDEVKRVKDELAQIARRVDDSENARRELEACNEELLRRQEALQLAVEHRDALRESKARREARQQVEEELAAARKTLEEQQAEITALENREAQLAKTKGRIEETGKECESVAAEKESLLAKEEAAEEALRRARSEETEQARQLRRSELERKALELESASKANRAELDKTAKVRAHHAELEKCKQRAAELVDARQRSTEYIHTFEAEKHAAERRLELVEVAGRVSQKRRTQLAIEELEKVRDEAMAVRAKAGEHRARARELVAGLPPDLPDSSALDNMRQLAHELEVAEATLGGGLAVVVERLRSVAIQGLADGTEVDLSSDTASFEARRGFVLQIGDVAMISVTAGEREARKHEAALRDRWDSEVAPVLARLEASDIASLVARGEEAAAVRKQAEDAESTAAGLEARATVHEEQLAKLAGLQEELAAVARELEGKPVEEAAKLLDELDGSSLDAYRSELKKKLTEAQAAHDSAQAELRRIDTESQVQAERTSTTEKAVAELGIAKPETGWDTFEARLAERAEKLHAEQWQVTLELESLVAEQGAEVEKAESELEAIREMLEGIESKLAESKEKLDALREQANRLEGEIENRRVAVAKLDVEAAKKQVAEITARLEVLPPPARTFTDDELLDAEQKVTEAEQAYERAKDDVRQAEGALRTVGGQVVIEQQDAAKDALRQAEQKEREVELEYDAWRLLVEKLREAENTEGQHLGEALSQPLTESFARLTAGRYGKIEVAPNLQTEGLRVAGVLRAVDALSVGTQEQLATLLRLTVAEQLGSTLVLDDHLTQTDPARSAWFRAILREHAARTQLIILTCRPLDYLEKEDLPTEGEVMAVRAAGMVRVIDLSRVIVRSESTPPATEEFGSE